MNCKINILHENIHTKETSLLIGNKVGSSVIKPAATIGIMAVKILSRKWNGKNGEEKGKRDVFSLYGFVVIHSKLSSVDQKHKWA